MADKKMMQINPVELMVQYYDMPMLQHLYAVGAYQFRFYPALKDCPATLCLRHEKKEYLAFFSEEDKKLSQFKECGDQASARKPIAIEKQTALLSGFKACLDQHNDEAAKPSIVVMKDELLGYLDAVLDLSEASKPVCAL